jgi:hypothetical protein
MDVLVAIAVGLIGGAVAGYLGARPAVRRLVDRAKYPGVVFGFSAAVTLAMVPVAFFFSFIVGGNFGGALGAALSESLGRGTAGVPFGLALGIGAVLAIGISLAAVVGATIGGWASRAMERKRAP